MNSCGHLQHILVFFDGFWRGPLGAYKEVFPEEMAKPHPWRGVSEATKADLPDSGLDDLMSRLSRDEKIQQITPDGSLGGLALTGSKPSLAMARDGVSGLW